MIVVSQKLVDFVAQLGIAHARPVQDDVSLRHREIGNPRKNLLHALERI